MVQTSCLSKLTLLPRHLRRHVSGVKTNLSYFRQIFSSQFIFLKIVTCVSWTGELSTLPKRNYFRQIHQTSSLPSTGGHHAFTATPIYVSYCKNLHSLFTAVALTKPSLVNSRWEEPHVLRKAPKHVLRNIIQGLHSNRRVSCVLQVKKPTTVNRQKQLHNRRSTHTSFKTFWLAIQVKFPNWG